jgi:hypothetical protein
MKKKDAVSKLKDIHNRIFTSEMMEQYTDLELCEMMLDKIETEIGMLPPSQDAPFPINEWEKE